ncbi:MAG: ECF-type sigma factor [Verrucomicrobiota bacterium]|jgi:RNA polymerase sigma factor (TIGR02999 family)
MCPAAEPVTRIRDAVGAGEAQAAEKLLPLVYEELRRLAAAKMAGEAPGQTLQPTALVHEAWLRLLGDGPRQCDGRGHFFAAAAEAMRRILVENARRKRRLRHGGNQQRVGLEEAEVPAEPEDDKVLEVDEALDQLAREDPLQAQVVKLRFFAGLTNEEVAAVLGVSAKTVEP